MKNHPMWKKFWYDSVVWGALIWIVGIAALVLLTVPAHGLVRCPPGPDGTIISVPDAASCSPPARQEQRDQRSLALEGCAVQYGSLPSSGIQGIAEQMEKINKMEALRAQGAPLLSWGQCDELQREQVRRLK